LLTTETLKMSVCLKCMDRQHLCTGYGKGSQWLQKARDRTGWRSTVRHCDQPSYLWGWFRTKTTPTMRS